MLIEKVEAAGVVVDIMNSSEKEKGGEDACLTPKKVLVYCLIIGLISAVFSIFLD